MRTSLCTSIKCLHTFTSRSEPAAAQTPVIDGDVLRRDDDVDVLKACKGSVVSQGSKHVLTRLGECDTRGDPPVRWELRSKPSSSTSTSLTAESSSLVLRRADGGMDGAAVPHGDVR